MIDFRNPKGYSLGGLLDIYSPKVNMQPNFVPLGNEVMPYQSAGLDSISGDFGPNYGDAAGGLDGMAGDRGPAYAGSLGNITAKSQMAPQGINPMALMGVGQALGQKPQQQMMPAPQVNIRKPQDFQQLYKALLQQYSLLR